MKVNNTSKYDLDGIPPLKEAVPLALQHLLAMIVGNMVPAILIANVVGLNQTQSTMLIQGSMLAAGLATFLQLYPIPLFKGYKIGVRLPLMMGMSYVFLGACISVAAEHGLAALFGAQIAAGVIVFLVGFIIKKIRHIFTAVISGTIIACMGIGLFSTAIKNLAGGEGTELFGNPINFLIGGFVTIIIIMINKFGKGLVKNSSILIGIVVGYAVSLAAGIIDFSAVHGAAFISLPTPVAFGLEFKPELIAMFTIIYIIGIVDMMGASTIVTMGAMDREVTDEELSSIVLGNSISSIISSVFSALPTGVFSQNTVIVSMNKVISRYVIALGAAVLLLAGVSPYLGAIMTTIPNCVIGGATIVVFSSIAMSGFSIIGSDGFTEENNLIAGVSIAVSIGVSTFPQVLNQFPDIVQTIVGNSYIVSGAVIAILLQTAFKLKLFSKDEIAASKEKIG
jgi:uracil-xanthine permease